MDIRRNSPHFNLSSNPLRPEQRQIKHPSTTAAATVTPATVSTTAISDEEFDQLIQEPPKAQENPQHQPPQPSQPQPTVNQFTQTNQLQPQEKPKKGKHVHVKYVAAGAITLSLILIASVAYQQWAISSLKSERKVLSEQLKVQNPIKVGNPQ